MRPFEPSDLPQVMAVYDLAIHSLAAPFYTPEQLDAWSPRNQDINRWQKRLAPLHTLVADHEGVIAGFVSYESNGHLDLLFVHPAFARQGVARRLCRRVEEEFRAAGVSRIFTEGSLAARPFFEHFGFTVEAEELVTIRGVQLRRYAMQKRIEG